MFLLCIFLVFYFCAASHGVIKNDSQHKPLLDANRNLQSYERENFLLCYVKQQEIIKHYGLDSLLLGMTSQRSEREDHIIVDDLRGQFSTHHHHNVTHNT